MNLVAEASESLYIFQPGGYFVRTNTSAAGMYAAPLQECKPRFPAVPWRFLYPATFARSPRFSKASFWVSHIQMA